MGLVFDIQRFCLHDGPGLRTTVFFKGCPLRCRWCSNPESQHLAVELFYNETRCMDCGTCIAACPRSLIERKKGGGLSTRRKKCAGCGSCEDACPTRAIARKGQDMTVAAVLDLVLQDRDFYTRSGGGITISGGEPFLQADFLFDLLRASKEAGLDTAVETTLHAEWAEIERCLPFVDHVLFDLKHPDPAVHRRWTGVGLGKILPNMERLCAVHPDVHPRVPVVPGCNTDAGAAAGFAERMTGLDRTVELLPYHTFGEGKYRMLGRAYPGKNIPGEQGLEHAGILRDYLRAHGINAEIHE